MSEENRKSMVHTLVALGQDINAQDPDGNTALHLALLRGDVELAFILVGAGALIDVPNKFKLTALQICMNLKFPKYPQLFDDLITARMDFDREKVAENIRAVIQKALDGYEEPNEKKGE